MRKSSFSKKLDKISAEIKNYFKITYPNQNDEYKLLSRAIERTKQIHDGQLRESKDPYVIHPLKVARYCAFYGLDYMCIIGALLHDSIEDRGIHKSEIEKEFGKTVAEIVDGTSKIKNLDKEKWDADKRATLRKLINSALESEFRTLIVKIFDRLDNMDDLEIFRLEKRKRISEETITIYQGLAYGLGMIDIAYQLKTKAFKFLEPNRFLWIQSLINTQRRGMEAEAVMMKEMLSNEIAKVKISFVSSITWPSPSDYYYTTSGTFTFIPTIKILLDHFEDIYPTLGYVHKFTAENENINLVPNQIRDYIALPRANGYKGLLTQLKYSKGQLNVEIVTKELDRKNRLGILSEWRNNDRHSHYKEYLKLLQKLPLDKTELSYVDAEKYTVSTINQMIVFSNQGGVYYLPYNSTILDLAYTMGEHIGNTCQGAVVNGKTQGVSIVLKEGDIVEIISGETVANTSSSNLDPAGYAVGRLNTMYVQREWLDIVETFQAKYCIRNALRTMVYIRAEKNGELIWNSFLKQLSNNDRDRIINSRIIDGKILRLLGLRTEKLTGKTFIQLLNKAGFDNIEHILNIASNVEKKFIIKVSNPHDPYFKIATCCSPVPGVDPIVGIKESIEEEQCGIKIHRIHCRNIKKLKKDKEKLKWEVSFIPHINLIVDVEDRDKILDENLKIVRQLDARLIRIIGEPNSGEGKKAILKMYIECKNNKQLYNIIYKMRKIKGVNRVYRELSDFPKSIVAF